MQRNAIEPILGALVLAAAVAFLVFAYNKAGQRSFNGYPLTARFSSIGGLETGGDVRIGGVKVGQITGGFRGVGVDRGPAGRELYRHPAGVVRHHAATGSQDQPYTGSGFPGKPDWPVHV